VRIFERIVKKLTNSLWEPNRLEGRVPESDGDRPGVVAEETMVSVSFVQDSLPKVLMKQRKCVKKIYSMKEVEEIVKDLRKTASEYLWKQEICGLCDGWHVVRIARPGYVSEEAKKAIALWKARQHASA